MRIKIGVAAVVSAILSGCGGGSGDQAAADVSPDSLADTVNVVQPVVTAHHFSLSDIHKEIKTIPKVVA